MPVMTFTVCMIKNAHADNILKWYKVAHVHLVDNH